MKVSEKTDKLDDVLGFKLKYIKGRKISRANRRQIWGVVQFDQNGMTISGGDLTICPSSEIQGTIFQGEPVLIDLTDARIENVPENFLKSLTGKTNHHKMCLTLNDGSIFVLKTNCTKTHSESSTFLTKMVESNVATNEWITMFRNSAKACNENSLGRTKDYHRNPNRVFSRYSVTIGSDGKMVSNTFTNQLIKYF